MENSFQTSFIPKKPVASSSVKKTPISFFSVFSVVILIIMGLGSGVLYLYKNYLTQQKKDLSVSISNIKSSFEEDKIKDLELYDKRASTAKKVLSGHIVLSPLFALLGSLTIPEIQYTEFSHETNGDEFNVKISGIASSYKSIALQADAFNIAKGRSFKNIIFSNLTRNKDNKVTFNLSFNVDPALLSYEKNIVLEQSQKVEPEIPVETSLTPPPSTNNTTNVTP